MNAEATVHAFVKVYADSAHYQGGYKRYARDEVREHADIVACAALELIPGFLLRLVDTLVEPPYLIWDRKNWIANATDLILGHVAYPPRGTRVGVPE